MRQVTTAAIATAAACVLGAIVLANLPAGGHSAPPVTHKTKVVTGRPAVKVAPFYLALDARSGSVTVRRTATGAKIATVRKPGGANFAGVAGSAGDRTFALATLTSSGSHIYVLHLNARGHPGRLAKTAIQPLPAHVGDCPVALAGLAVSQDDRKVAVSVLSNCPDGRAGPSEILTAQLASGRTLATFHPGNSYPMWLSWSATGSLAYSLPSAGIYIIPNATRPTSAPRLAIRYSASAGGFSGADRPLLTPDGSAIIATVARGSSTSAIADFSVRGTARHLLTPPVRDPAQFCGALWTDFAGRRLLTGCGDDSEYEIRNRHLTRLSKPWQLPAYNVPSGPAIAW